MQSLAERVVDATSVAGIPADTHGAVAAKALFRRPIARWEQAAGSWLDDPDQEKALILVSVVVDGRPVWAGDVAGDRLALAFAAARNRQEMLRRLAIFALAHRPPTGFFGNFVLEAGGERKGTIDIKHGGLLPIVDLARSVAMAAGVAGATTAARLQAAAAAGTLSEANSRTLADAFELCNEMRMEHQLDQIRRGEPPDDYLTPASLSRIARSSLKDAFRSVASVQREIASEMGLRPR
jgi:CBS domain-containing protein